MKLFRTDEIESVRHLIHFAWYYEQLRSTGHFPVYYHYGQWFLDDDNGCWFLVFEFIKGKSLKEVVAHYSPPKKEALFLNLAYAVADIHPQTNGYEKNLICLWKCHCFGKTRCQIKIRNQF